MVINPRIRCRGWLPWYLHRRFPGSTDNRSGQTSVPFSSVLATWLRAGFLLTIAFSDHLCVEFNTVNLRLQLLTVGTVGGKQSWQKTAAAASSNLLSIYGNGAQISGLIVLSV